MAPLLPHETINRPQCTAKAIAFSQININYKKIKWASNKKHFSEMNSYVGMTMVKKEQGQDDFFQSIILLHC